MANETRVAPYPADTLAKGWRFEIDVDKIKESDTWLLAKTGALKGALLLLWARSWTQTPCGTLPASDELIALLLEMSNDDFELHRHVLMRGWEQCSDGRYYHATITCRVLAMIEKRKSDAVRAADSRARRAASDSAHVGVKRASRVTRTGRTGEFDTKHYALDKPPQPPEAGGGFDRFWSLWPSHKRKAARRQCAEKWRTQGCDAIVDAVLAALDAAKTSEDWTKSGGAYIPAPLVWLNQARWEAFAQVADAPASPAETAMFTEHAAYLAAEASRETTASPEQIRAAREAARAGRLVTAQASVNVAKGSHDARE